MVKEVGSLVGKFLKGVGRITPGIAIIVDAIELGRLWKDIDTLPEALEKDELNENQQKIYEALQRKREASEDGDPELTATTQSYLHEKVNITFEERFRVKDCKPASSSCPSDPPAEETFETPWYSTRREEEPLLQSLLRDTDTCYEAIEEYEQLTQAQLDHAQRIWSNYCQIINEVAREYKKEGPWTEFRAYIHCMSIRDHGLDQTKKWLMSTDEEGILDEDEDPELTAIMRSYLQKDEEIDLEAEKDRGLEWHLIPRDQRLGDIHETIDGLEPRKSDPFPEPVVEFIMEKNEQGLSIEEIDKALVKMITDGKILTWIMHISDAEKEEFEGFSSENSYSGLYLVQPHSELIWTGAKTAIVKSKKFTKHINEPLYLISDKQCYGVIKLSEPEEIDKEEFDERYEEHLVENFEREEWWGAKKFPLYLYEVEGIEKFEPIKEVEVPRGIQVFLRPESVKFV